MSASRWTKITVIATGMAIVNHTMDTPITSAVRAALRAM